MIRAVTLGKSLAREAGRLVGGGIFATVVWRCIPSAPLKSTATLPSEQLHQARTVTITALAYVRVSGLCGRWNRIFFSVPLASAASCRVFWGTCVGLCAYACCTPLAHTSSPLRALRRCRPPGFAQHRWRQRSRPRDQKRGRLHVTRPRSFVAARHRKPRPLLWSFSHLTHRSSATSPRNEPPS